MASHTVGTKEGKTERRLPTTIKNGANVRQSGGVRDKYRKMTGGVFSTASTAAAGCALQEKKKKKKLNILVTMRPLGTLVMIC